MSKVSEFILELDIEETNIKELSKMATVLLGRCKKSMNEKIILDSTVVDSLYNVIQELMGEDCYPYTKMGLEYSHGQLSEYGYPDFEIDIGTSTEYNSDEAYVLGCYCDQNFLLMVEGQNDKIFNMRLGGYELCEWFSNLKEYLHYIFTIELIAQGKIDIEELAELSEYSNRPNYTPSDIDEIEDIVEYLEREDI